MLVEQHAEDERERVAAEEFVGGGVLGYADIGPAQSCLIDTRGRSAGK